MMRRGRLWCAVCWMLFAVHWAGVAASDQLQTPAQRPQQGAAPNQSPAAAPAAVSTCRPANGTAAGAQLAVVGILTTGKKVERRNLIRSTYLRHRPAELLVCFVVCAHNTGSVSSSLVGEVARHGDMVVMDCMENMNDGKTHRWFQYAHEHFGGYRAVLKADDDTFIHLPNLARELAAKVVPRAPAYYGRQLSDEHRFMVGMLYGFTQDLLALIGGRMRRGLARTRGHEDQVSAMWLKDLRYTLVSSQATFIDHPASGKGWAAPIRPDTVAVHKCKHESMMLDAYRVAFQTGNTA